MNISRPRTSQRIRKYSISSSPSSTSSYTEDEKEQDDEYDIELHPTSSPAPITDMNTVSAHKINPLTSSAWQQQLVEQISAIEEEGVKRCENVTIDKNSIFNRNNNKSIHTSLIATPLSILKEQSDQRNNTSTISNSPRSLLSSIFPNKKNNTDRKKSVNSQLSPYHRKIKQFLPPQIFKYIVNMPVPTTTHTIKQERESLINDILPLTDSHRKQQQIYTHLLSHYENIKAILEQEEKELEEVATASGYLRVTSDYYRYEKPNINNKNNSNAKDLKLKSEEAILSLNIQIKTLKNEKKILENKLSEYRDKNKTFNENNNINNSNEKYPLGINIEEEVNIKKELDSKRSSLLTQVHELQQEISDIKTQQEKKNKKEKEILDELDNKIFESKEHADTYNLQYNATKEQLTYVTEKSAILSAKLLAVRKRINKPAINASYELDEFQDEFHL